MRITGRAFLVISQSFIFLYIFSALHCNANNYMNESPLESSSSSIEFYAVNDTFHFVTNCENSLLFDDVLKNDVFQKSENTQICYVFAPKVGVLTFGSNGKFTLKLPDDYAGVLEFRYSLCNKSNYTEKSDAKVVVIVKNDYDCDDIINEFDIDNDNDGIPDVDEGNGLIDTDDDGVKDNFDIDSDNDGITDNQEWQKEGYYLALSELDANNNGWDDAYDIDLKGVYYKPIDTNENGIPDFMDNDSDKDNILDNIEGFDLDNDRIADILPMLFDADNDGLDDAYDVISCWSLGCNSVGSNSPLPDFNNNGIRDWRDNGPANKPENNFSQSTDFLVYPNPTNGSFYINTPVPDEILQIEVQIFSILGIEVYRELINPGISKIKLENIVSGNYVIQVNSGPDKFRSILCIQ